LTHKKELPMPNINNITEDEEPIKSRTQIKNEMTALQKFGEDLVNLSDKLFEKIPLQGTLAEAVTQARKMKHREGRRRQLQFIGKLLRDTDLDELHAAYDKIKTSGQHQTRLLQIAEQWRDKLISDTNTNLSQFIQKYPDADAQHTRQLIRNAQKEASQQKPPTNSRKLFRYIRELIEE
jgi:ribosome-associated protein